MIHPENAIPDPLSDVPGAVIMALQKRTEWGVEQKALLEQLQKMLLRKGYIRFCGKTSFHHLASVGSSCLYDVPRNKRGHLSAFRGKRVRIVCVGSERLDSELMAGVFK